MLQSKYQRVGALAGLAMFLGGWLGAYYNHWAWPAITAVVVLLSFWYVVEDDSAEDLSTRAIRGFLLGAGAALIARVLGALTMVWAFDSWSTPVTEKYESISDIFRVLMNGSLIQSLIAIAAIGAVGAFIAYALPYFAAEREEE
jgi:hypothetical protein